jgi:malonyl-CoA O-methyltransferase
MHDLGDALLAERFADPVMDMEFLNLDYADGSVFIADAIALNLMGRITKNGADLEQLPKKLTLEVVYGHAWAIGKNLAKAKNQIAYIDPKQIIRKTRKELP